MILIILIILINTNLSNISIKLLLIGIRKIWFLEEFDIEYYILKSMNVSFPLKQEVKDNIRKKIIKKIYQGYRHQTGLPVHGQRTHSNSKTVKKTYSSNLLLSTGFKKDNLLRKKKTKPIKVNTAKKIPKGKKKKK